MTGSNRLLIFSVLFASTVFSGTLFAQSLDGLVVDSQNNPIPGVQVIVEGTRYGTVTDASGAFRFSDLPPDDYVIAFRFIGFRTARHTVDLRAADVSVTITLTDEAIEIDEVTVTADGQRQVQLTRSSLSVSTLDAADLSDVRGQSLGETLEHLPGITTLTTGPSITKPVIRGLHSDRLVIMNAGVRQEGQQWGGEHAPEIDPFAPDRIEVIRGSAGVEYGVGAIGGVIRIEPRELPDTPGYGGQVTMNGFSNSRQAAGSIHIEGAPSQIKGLGWRVQTSARKAGSSTTPDYVLGNTAYSELNGSLAIGYHRNNLGVETFVSRFATELGIYRGSHISTVEGLLAAIEQDRPPVEYTFSYDIDTPKQIVNHNVFSTKAHWERDAGDVLDIQYGIQQNLREEYDAHAIGSGDPGDRPAFDLELISQTLEVKYRTRPQDRFFSVFGISGMTQGNENNRIGYLIPNFRALTGGIFGRGVWSNNIVTLEAGSRLDYRWFRAFPRENGNSGAFENVVRDFASLSAVAGAIWQFHSAWSVALNGGTAWRPPNMSELYSYGLHHGTAQFEIGDPDLSAEQSINLDATIRHSSRRVNAELSAYLNRMSNYIHVIPTGEPTVTIRGVFPTFVYQQTDARLAGFDGLVEYSFARFLSAGLSASIVRAVDLDNDLDLINMPADRMHIHTVVALPAGRGLLRNELELGAKFVARQTRFPEGIDYADPPSGYHLLEADYRVQVQAGGTHLDISLGVNNILNESYRDYLSRYRYFADETGRTFILRVRIPIGSYR